MLQDILMYTTVALAVAYLGYKYLLPKHKKSSNKTATACGKDNCGCH